METLYRVYNPTNVPVNLVVDGKEVKIGGRSMVYMNPELAHSLMDLMPMLEYSPYEGEPVGVEKEEKPEPKKPSKPVKKSKR